MIDRRRLGGAPAQRGRRVKGVFGVVWDAFLGGNGQSYPFAVALLPPEGGEVVAMPAQIPHALTATQRFKMLLVVIKVEQ